MADPETLPLTEYAATPHRTYTSWADQLPDQVFNQIWDAFHSGTGIGEVTVLKWLERQGYIGGTPGKLKVIRTCERR